VLCCVSGDTEFHLEFDHSGKGDDGYYALKAIPNTVDIVRSLNNKSVFNPMFCWANQ